MKPLEFDLEIQFFFSRLPYYTMVLSKRFLLEV
jgi:hypothetical protein